MNRERSSGPPGNTIRDIIDWCVYAAVAISSGIFRFLGLATGYRSAAIAGSAWFMLFRHRRLIIHRNLEIALGDELDGGDRDRLGRECCRHALATVTDMAVREKLVRPDNWREYFTVDPVLDDALTTDHPRGLAILSAHLGSWEMGQFFCALRGTPVSPVMRVLDNPHLNRISIRMRTLRGGRVIPKQGALLGIHGVLRDGGVVAIMADQSAPPGESWLPFFGEPVSVYSNYARVLVRHDCRVIFSVCVREGFAFRFRFESVDLEVPSAGTIEQRTRALVQAYHDALEDAVRRHPEQYLWMHRKWKRQPEGRPSPYRELGRPLGELTDGDQP